MALVIEEKLAIYNNRILVNLQNNYYLLFFSDNYL